MAFGIGIGVNTGIGTGVDMSSSLVGLVPPCRVRAVTPSSTHVLLLELVVDDEWCWMV